MIYNLTFPRAVANQVSRNVQNGLQYLWDRIRSALNWANDSTLRLLLRNHNWVLHPRAFSSKVHAYAMNMFKKSNPSLKSYEDILPTLPIPDLRSSVKKYLLSVKPFVSSEEFESIETRSRYFVVEQGAELQKKLVQEANAKRNWFEETWLKAAYLENRFSSLYTAWYGMDSVIPTTNKYEYLQVDRAARLLHLIMQFKDRIRDGKLSPLEEDVPVCMHQFTRVFGANRVPDEKCDRLDVHADSKHIIVLARGKIYRLDLYDDANKPLNEMTIRERLRYISGEAQSDFEREDVSILSLQDRISWTKDKAVLAQDNKDNLDIMDTALFALRISEKSPETDTQLAQGLFQDASDLYIDKGITITTFANGKVGGTMEHTMADATIISKMIEWIFENENYKPDYQMGAESFIPISRLQWKLPTSIKQSIEGSKIYAQDTLAAMDLACNLFEDFGKEAIKSWNCSPDSFIQMALQLAYHRMNLEIPFTYESGSTRMFYHGRTETIRSGSMESLEFCRAMSNTLVTPAGKQAALKKAIKAHVKYKREAVSGMGCDRHLLALKRLAGDEKIDFFEKPDFNLTYSLATSQTPIRYAKGGGFAPPSMSGYGISYHITPNSIRFHISKNRCDAKTSQLMYEAISKAMNDMKALYEPIPSTNT